MEVVNLKTNIGLADLKYYYDNFVSYLKRNVDTLGIKYCSGALYGTYRMVNNILIEQPIEDLPEVNKVTDEDKKFFKETESLGLINKITIFEETYPIYLDDYGQSYGIVIDDKYIPFGTYNTDIQLAAVYEVFLSIYHKDLVELIKKGEE